MDRATMRFIIDTDADQKVNNTILKSVGIELDIPELMDFSYFKDESWKYIQVSFKVAAMRYYVDSYTISQCERFGMWDTAIAYIKKAAEKYGIPYGEDDSILPELYDYIERFHKLGFAELKKKFKYDFVNYAYRVSGYEKTYIKETYGISYPMIRRYLYNHGEG